MDLDRLLDTLKHALDIHSDFGSAEHDTELHLFVDQLVHRNLHAWFEMGQKAAANSEAGYFAKDLLNYLENSAKSDFPHDIARMALEETGEKYTIKSETSVALCFVFDGYTSVFTVRQLVNEFLLSIHSSTDGLPIVERRFPLVNTCIDRAAHYLNKGVLLG